MLVKIKRLCLITILAAHPGLLAAQIYGGIITADGTATDRKSDPPKRIVIQPLGSENAADRRNRPDPAAGFQDASALLAGNIPDPQAETLVSEGEAMTRATFVLPSLVRRRSVAYWSTEGDYVVTEWSFDEPFGKGLLILRDTPVWTFYYFKVFANSELGTVEGVTHFLTELFAWEQPPLGFGRLPVDVSLNNEAVVYLQSAWIDPLPTPGPGLFQLRGGGDRKQFSFSIQIGKWRARTFYSDRLYVPERIPSFTKQIAAWSAEILEGEFSKLPYPHLGSPSENRSRLIATELWQRGLSVDQFAKLLTVGDGQDLETRARILREQYREVKNQRLPLTYVRAAVDIYRSLGDGATAAPASFFQVKRSGCQPELEAMGFSFFWLISSRRQRFDIS